MKQISVDGVTYGVGDVRGLRDRAEKAEGRIAELEEALAECARAGCPTAARRVADSVSKEERHEEEKEKKAGGRSQTPEQARDSGSLGARPKNEARDAVNDRCSSNVPPGPCTGRLPALTAGVYTCTLREGHAGQHLADNGVSWTEPDEQRPSDACSKCGAVDPGDVYVYGMSFLSTENGKRICRDRDACARHSNDARIGYPCACTWVGKNEEARATLKPCEMHRIWAEGLRLDKVPGTGTLLLASGICLTAGEVDEVLAARRTDYPTVDRIRYGMRVQHRKSKQVGTVIGPLKARVQVDGVRDPVEWMVDNLDPETCSANPKVKP